MSINIKAFCKAARKKDVVTVKKGIEQKMGVDNLNVALHYACFKTRDNDEVVALLLTAKADVNSIATGGDPIYKRTSLLLAASYNIGLGVMAKLVNAGANVCITDQYDGGGSIGGHGTALHWIACYGDGFNNWPKGDNDRSRIPMAEYLLQHGAQPCLDIKSKSGLTPYDYAVKRGRKDLARFYRDWKPSSSSSSSSPKQNELKQLSDEIHSDKQLYSELQVKMEMAEAAQKQLKAQNSL